MTSGYQPENESPSRPASIGREGDRLERDIGQSRDQDEILVHGPEEEPEKTQAAAAGCRAAVW